MSSITNEETDLDFTDVKQPLDTQKDNIIKFEYPKESIGKTNKKYNLFKRMADIVISSLALVVLSPVFFITSIAIKIDSEGPVIFKQKRIGKDGKLFNIYKFRSMSANNNASDLSVPDKYTGIGKFIRKTSIDELPQLVNILKGDMSIIGPRPWTPMYYENMTEEQKHRYDVLPGITGLAQINGRNCASVIDRINYDLEYVNNYSFKSDVDIVFKTFSVLLCKEGEDGGKGTVQNDMDELRNQNIIENYDNKNIVDIK